MITDLIINKKILIHEIYDVHSFEIKSMAKIMINGEWVGLTKEYNKLYDYLKNKKSEGHINKTVCIIMDYNNKELHVNCDGGRLYRPLLKVKNNKLVLTKEMLDDIDLSGKNLDKINTWNKFLSKYPDAIEYVDIEESEKIIISMDYNGLNKNYETSIKKINNPNINGDPINRYNNTIYVNYTHQEIHPMLMLGILSSSIPFSDHN
jgi:DNA-directed RNA polymerase II subunit RPB2